LDDLAGPLEMLGAAVLQPDLDDSLVPASGQHHRPPFLNRPRQWFLHIDILPGVAGIDCHRSMPVIGSGHDDRIDVFAIKQSPMVSHLLGSWSKRCAGFQPFLKNITHGHKLCVGGKQGLRSQKRPTRAAPDEGQSQAIVGAQHTPAEAQHRACG
jgi:hypothetical protein